MTPFVKRSPTAPPGFFAGEAAGLRWLSAARSARCANVIAFDDTSLTLELLEPIRPAAVAATEFGRALAHTHDAGAPHWGAPPDDWHGPGYFGPLERPLPMSYAAHPAWGALYAEERLRPMATRALGGLSADVMADVDEVIKRCESGTFDDDDTPGRLHGDLWSGNVMWTVDGVVLIDPAAHGGHRETDIAVLHLFGCPHLDAIVDGYHQVHPLKAGWQDRVALHQLYPLLAHVALFGAGYARQTHAAARAALKLS